MNPAQVSKSSSGNITHARRLSESARAAGESPWIGDPSVPGLWWWYWCWQQSRSRCCMAALIRAWRYRASVIPPTMCDALAHTCRPSRIVRGRKPHRNQRTGRAVFRIFMRPISQIALAVPAQRLYRGNSAQVVPGGGSSRRSPAGSAGLCRGLVHEPSAVATEKEAGERRPRRVIAVVFLRLKFCCAIV
jgi:hypothetical protein